MIICLNIYKIKILNNTILTQIKVARPLPFSIIHEENMIFSITFIFFWKTEYCIFLDLFPPKQPTLAYPSFVGHELFLRVSHHIDFVYTR